MITVFNRSCCFTGVDLTQFSEARGVLDENKIPYKCKMRNQSGPFAPQGAVKGSAEFGGAAGAFVQYEIFVHRQDEAKARHLIKTGHTS